MTPTKNSNPQIQHKTPVNTDIFLRSFERHLRAGRKDPDTVAHYAGATRQFADYCDVNGLPDLATVTREHIEMWLENLHTRLAPYSVRNRYIGLRQFFKWMLDEGEVSRNPMERMKPPSIEEVEKDVVGAEDMARVFSYLEKEKRWRDLVVIAVLYDAGLRATELSDCLAEDVDLERGFIRIRTTKNDEARRPAIDPRTVLYIDRYWRRERRRAPMYLVNGERGKFSRFGIYHVVRGVFAEVGIKGVIGAHDMRHTSATHVALSREMSESEMMSHYGWSDIKMVRHYTKAALQQQAQDAHRKASPMGNLPKVPRGRPKKG